MAELKTHIPRREKLTVLEIGCSSGRWLRWFEKEYGAQVYGVDLNPVQASKVDRFILGDGLNLPLLDGTFDIVFSLGLIEHFPDVQTRERLVAEHVRVAKQKTGVIWIGLPNMNFSLSCLWTKFYYDHILGYQHYRVTSQEMFRHFRHGHVQILRSRFLGWFPAILMRHLTRRLCHHDLSLAGAPAGRWWEKKLFEHSWTADDFLIIGRKE
ncbi:MAG: class I SAM-dependent methyltransferase [Candidatus Omnitrophica bacterium]|nr:class I SAM-dependent methyltransferase [Candidatus Omnitrophota bacterium]